MEKSKIYNVIILDKSGSMTSCRKLAVDSVNETLGAIRASSSRNENTDYYVTLVAFCGCGRNVIVDNKLITEVDNIGYEEYSPCCSTPLYDAIGFTVTSIHDLVSKEENSVASVTIITDGYENSSKEFGRNAIKALIDSYKSKGWMFAYIGADHDVESVAFSLSIDNCMRFEKGQQGFRNMTCAFNRSLSSWSDECSAIMAEQSVSKERKRSLMSKISERFFDK